MKIKILILAFFCYNIGITQNKYFTEQNLSINKFIEGTLLLPSNKTNTPLAIIIGGSGPTDRNGNQNFQKNNSLKKLAEALSIEGIATFRYDKRVVKQIKQGIIDKDIMFDDFIDDAISTSNYFKKQRLFNKIYIVGHSQGSLVGMVAAKNRADGFISIAGAGQSIDNVIIEQINLTAPQFNEETKRIFAALKKGRTVKDYPQALTSIFKEDIQGFMRNWIQYKPTEIITELKIPILIINGDKDLQVSVEEANTLKKAAPKAKLMIVKNMNHVLVPIAGDNLDNSKSYNQPNREISEELIEHISKFINSN
ncbi:alpha/beta hydrolase [uncultured Algibacter sp.]|uniref:alpha/beta hydrolase family protein n=1 Tax=uncultured Algibacter sp. TaxID=298659 RepID=UPI00260E432D|nr:alpha/beta hydrolase [uncultured Algibacter sp.]